MIAKLFHSNADFIDINKKWKAKDGDRKNIIKPSCVISYNKGMGGVDKNRLNIDNFNGEIKTYFNVRKIIF